MIWLLSMAFAADTPCYGHTHTTRLDTEHYWVEWQTPTINGDQAADLGDWAEAARDVYVDMGWPITAEPVALLAVPPILEPDTMSGLTRTHPCSVGDDVHPRVELFFGWYEDEAARGLVSHELAHVAQYGYVSPFTAATGTWMWWLEASATWMELKVTGDERAWARTTSGYLNQPWLGLHQPQAALLDPFRTGHMYGGTVFVRFLELNYGGPDVIRDSWAWAAQQDGQPVTVEDGLTGMGLDPDAVWHHWMAVATTAQLGVFTEIDSGIDVEERVQRWPRNGGPSTGAPAEDRLPQGHGLSTIRFDAELAPPGQAVQVRFEGDPGVRWRVVLARVDGARRGAPRRRLHAPRRGRRHRRGLGVGHGGPARRLPRCQPRGRRARRSVVHLVRRAHRRPGPHGRQRRARRGHRARLCVRWGGAVVGTRAVGVGTRPTTEALGACRT